jgi:hypothetical protein
MLRPLIVDFPPGGPIDKMARALEEPLQEALGNIVIIENRTGAGELRSMRSSPRRQRARRKTLGRESRILNWSDCDGRPRTSENA